jgi:hypothetical protein
MLPSSLVSPPAPATGSLLLLSTDSFVSTVLYRPDGSADAPAFTFTSASEGKHITLRHGGATGSVAGELILHGLLQKGVGMVKLTGGEEMKVEHWGKIMKGGVAVTVHGSEYVWTKVVEKDSKNPNALRAPYYEVCYPPACCPDISDKLPCRRYLESEPRRNTSPCGLKCMPMTR